MIDEKEFRFIQSYFKIRECEKYKGRSFELCECNRPKSAHKFIPVSAEEWSYERNTTQKPCDTFGNIRFTGFDDISASPMPKFIRFNYIEYPEIYECVYKLMVHYWSIPSPKLIISINGGFKRMNFKNNLIKKNFKQGLINVIRKDNTWIIGGGFNVGIHKLVSEAVHEYRLHHENCQNQVKLIGISLWGVVYNNHALLPKPANGEIKPENRQYKYSNCMSDEKGKVALDPYYDCYLFCDDGTDKTYDRGVDFRMEFEKYVVNQDEVFIVQILFEGGKRALFSAYKSLKNNLNIVVIKGSGRASDLVSEVMELSNRKFISNINSILEDSKDKLNIQKNDINEIKRIVTDMYKNYKKQIIIYDMFDLNTKLDKSILEAIISGHNAQDLTTTLKLAIRFDCPSIAEKNVFTNTNYITIKSQSINNMFLGVLQKNKYEFVRLFLQNGLEIESVINKGKLENLYVESMTADGSQCFELLHDLINERNTCIRFQKSKKSNTYVLLQSIGAIIPSISGNILKSRYVKERHLVAELFHDVDVEIRSTSISGTALRNVNSSVTTQDLLIWAVLSGHIELAEIFWEIGKDHVGSALIASTILKNMATLTLKRGDIDLEAKLKNASDKFQNYATDVVIEAYSRNKLNTYDMLVRALTRWDNMTCIQIALSGNLLDFLNNSACRSYAMKVWMGNMSPFLSYWKILINIPLSVILIKPLIIPYLNNEEEEVVKVHVCRSDSIEMSLSNKLQSKVYKPKRSKTVPFNKAMQIFYQAPIIKFTINLISYIGFLIIFSYMNLSELQPLQEVNSWKDMWAEIFVCVYVLSILVEEIRQVIDQERTGNIIYKFIAYLSGSWNIYDIILIILFLSSVIVRYTIPEDNFIICRCLFSLSLSMFCIRTMQFYFVNKYIGPKVIMIREMIRDILFFLSIFSIFILSYGTLSHSLRHPNSDVDILLLKDIIYLPYFQTYGELMLDEIERNATCISLNCYIENATVMIGFGIFLLLTNVLLINLLIAMFGYTFNQIQGNSGKHWSFIHMQLVEEFYEKPFLPPPFNLIYYVFKVIFYLLNKIRSKKESTRNNLLVKSLNFYENNKISGYEQFCLEAFLSESNTVKCSDKSEIDVWMHDLADLFEKVTTTPEASALMKRPTFLRNNSIQKRFSKKPE